MVLWKKLSVVGNLSWIDNRNKPQNAVPKLAKFNIINNYSKQRIVIHFLAKKLLSPYQMEWQDDATAAIICIVQI